MASRIPFGPRALPGISSTRQGQLGWSPKIVVVSADPMRALVHRQLAAWKEDPRLHTGQLYLLSPLNSLDIEVSSVGEARVVEQSLLRAFLQRGSQGAVGPFEDVREGERMLVYPLVSQGRVQGIWILFPTDPYASVAAWEESAQRFSGELFALTQAGMGDPPTFRQLVEAFPENEESEPVRNAKPHWERSRSQAAVPADEELSAGLIVDHLPLF